MSRLFLRLMLVVGIGMTGAACLDDGYAAPRGYYQPAPGYSNPYYNGGFPPAPSRNGYSHPAPYHHQKGHTTRSQTHPRHKGGRVTPAQPHARCTNHTSPGY